MITITPDDTAVDWHYENYMHDNLLSLLSTSTFEGRLRDRIENEVNDLNNMDRDTYDKLSFSLFSNQLDRITSGMNYSATDILRHLRKLK